VLEEKHVVMYRVTFKKTAFSLFNFGFIMARLFFSHEMMETRHNRRDQHKTNVKRDQKFCCEEAPIPAKTPIPVRRLNYISRTGNVNPL
jgi:hypothetical protein